jgi:hypothetical protein
LNPEELMVGEINMDGTVDKKSYDLTTWLGISLGVCFFIYLLFYSIADYVRKLNRIIDPAELSPPLRAWYVLPRDGVELWVLYISVTSVVFLTLFFIRYEKIWHNFKPIIFKLTKFVCLPVLIVSFIVRPPPCLSILSNFGELISVMLVAFVLWFSLLGLYQLKKKLFMIVISVLLAPVCFIAIGPLSAFDYNFILDPALRLLHGFKISEIYFQYDLLLSLILTPFLFLRVEPNMIQLIFQLSYYVFFILLLLLSNSVFFNKVLSVSFIFSLVVMRFFAIQYEPTYSFQLTPLRLDLWLIPLSCFWYFGMLHWSVGFSLGVLVLVHRNFGTIYMAAYFACLFTNYAIIVNDMFPLEKKSLPEFKSKTISFLRSTLPTALIPVAAFIISMIVYKDFGISHAARLYASFGFGFDAINRSSYYWYTPALISFVTILLFKMRTELPRAYLTTVFFVIYLVIGNSLYFFGRSHESNVLAISGSILFLLFIFIDILVKYFNIELCIPKFSRNGVRKKSSYTFVIPFLPMIIVLCSVFYYSKNIKDRLRTQFINVRTGNFYQAASSRINLDGIKGLTEGSSKVYPMVFANDFHFYYYGNYVPTAYWLPYASWVLKGDQIEYLQSLLNSGYYLVYNVAEKDYIDGQKEILSALRFSQSKQLLPYVVIHK